MNLFTPKAVAEHELQPGNEEMKTTIVDRKSLNKLCNNRTFEGSFHRQETISPSSNFLNIFHSKLFSCRHDIQHKDTQHNGIQHIDTQHKEPICDTQHNNTD